MTAIKIKTISMVQLPPAKSQKNLFHVALTEKASTMLAFFFIYILLNCKTDAINIKQEKTAADLQQPFYYLSIPQGNDFSPNALSFLTAS